MSKSLIDQIECGQNISTYETENNRIIMTITDESGEGKMTLHRICDGVCILYNDMHLSKCKSQFQLRTGTELFCIDHCREGRIESEIGNGACSYLEEHELRVDNRKSHAGNVTFPFHHYYGISIGFDLKIANEGLKKLLDGFSVDLYKLRDKYCNTLKPYVIQKEVGIEHIFTELYQVPAKIKDDYYKVKILELLLYLDALEILDSKQERPYFYKSQVEKTRAIHEQITQNLQEHYTLEQLSNQYKISLTGMKTCFKHLYGDSINSYLRRYRINTAAHYLKRDSNKTVAEIAGIVGYESPSKFTSAFHKIIGCTPMEYKKSIDQSE